MLPQAPSFTLTKPKDVRGDIKCESSSSSPVQSHWVSRLGRTFQPMQVNTPVRRQSPLRQSSLTPSKTVQPQIGKWPGSARPFRLPDRGTVVWYGRGDKPTATNFSASWTVHGCSAKGSIEMENLFLTTLLISVVIGVLVIYHMTSEG
jgi:hypothetical protein